MLQNKILKQINNQKLNEIEDITLYESEIDGEVFIDFITFSFSNGFDFGVHVDSTGENLDFISIENILSSIHTTNISYINRKLLLKTSKLLELNYKCNDIEGIKYIKFILDDLDIEVSLNLDSLKINACNDNQ